MPVTAISSAPYAPAKAILEVVTRYRAKGIPQPIDEGVLSRVGISDSLISRTLQSMQTLDLIDDKGAVTATFESLKLAPEGEFKERIAQWLNAAYSDVLKFVDPHTADDTTLRDAFRIYNPPGQRDRMITLFTGLYAAAGIGPEKTRVRASRPRATPTAAGNTSKRQNGKSNEEQGKPLSDDGTPETKPPKQDQDTSHQDGAHSKSFERELLSKFPPFDPAWGDDLKAKWFEGFQTFMVMAAPKG